MTPTVEPVTKVGMNGAPSEVAGESAVQIVMDQLELLRAYFRGQADTIRQLQAELDATRSERDTYLKALHGLTRDEFTISEDERREMETSGLTLSHYAAELRQRRGG